MIKAYETTREILHKRRSPYEGIRATALIMLETNFPIYMNSPLEAEPDPEDYSNHAIHDMQHNWPYNLFNSLTIEEFALHIATVGEERLPVSDWIEMVYTVSRFVASGEWFTVGLGDNLYMAETGGRISGMTRAHQVLPFNYTNVGPNLQMVWATRQKLREYINTLSQRGQLAIATQSISMDNELRLATSQQ